jgi:predicted nuclease of predicted toxin-antitoxin system
MSDGAPGLRFLADMNLSPKTVAALQQRGWDIIRVSQVLPVTASDPEILEFARQHDRVVVTQDLDFSTLLALGGYNQPSLITLRLSVSDPETVTRKLLQIVPQVEPALRKGCAVTVEDYTLRVRMLPIRTDVPGHTVGLN